MRVGVLGINHKLANLKLREQLAKACQKLFGTFRNVHEQHYFVLLSTCNRTEVYFSSDDLASSHTYLLKILRDEIDEEFDHKLYSYFGSDCFCHLTRVTLGLDSAIITETEIQGQVKLAYETSCEYYQLPGVLHFLFQKSLAIAKKLRTELQLGRGMPSLEHAILQAGKQVFQFPEKIQILLVGASEINQKIMAFLKNRNFQNMTLCNRSDVQMPTYVDRYGVKQLPWSNLNHWYEYDWVIFGTKSPDYLIKYQEISQKRISQKLIIDLCVPRNVEPLIGKDQRIKLLNIDEIIRLIKIRYRFLTNTLAEAERRVQEITLEHACRYSHKTKLTPIAVTA